MNTNQQVVNFGIILSRLVTWFHLLTQKTWRNNFCNWTTLSNRRGGSWVNWRNAPQIAYCSKTSHREKLPLTRIFNLKTRGKILRQPQEPYPDILLPRLLTYTEYEFISVSRRKEIWPEASGLCLLDLSPLVQPPIMAKESNLPEEMKMSGCFCLRRRSRPRQ